MCFSPAYFPIPSINNRHNEFRVAFSTGPGRLALMNFKAYSYGWRFTYRTYRERVAAV
jgi:hypothetical protein